MTKIEDEEILAALRDIASNIRWLTFVLMCCLSGILGALIGASR